MELILTDKEKNLLTEIITRITFTGIENAIIIVSIANKLGLKEKVEEKENANTNHN